MANRANNWFLLGSALLCAAALLCSGSAGVGAAEEQSPNPTAAPGFPIASDARLAGDAKQTRFVLDLDKPIQFRAFTLADPYRVVVDIPQVDFRLPAEAGATGRGLIQAFRYGLVMPGGSRIVFDLTGPARIAKSYVLDAANGQPPRLVLELEQVDRTGFVQSLAAESRPELRPALSVAADPVVAMKTAVPEPAAAAPAADSRPVVVIDPGHGGYDSGTEAGAPLLEKDLALQIALRLQGELACRGVHAILTRTGDYFVTLADRTAFANKAGADLFISIHLNSSPAAATTGIETYYLNNTTDRATMRLAAMENASGGAYGTATGGDLNYILSDMRQQYKANESVALASMIEAQTAADLNASLGAQVSALGAMRGPFYVLVGAQMPAVLVECGFLSNRDEAARLASAQYQQVLAQGIAEAVVHYFNADAAVGNL